jgi:hypothetical protein
MGDVFIETIRVYMRSLVFIDQDSKFVTIFTEYYIVCTNVAGML